MTKYSRGYGVITIKVTSVPMKPAAAGGEAKRAQCRQAISLLLFNCLTFRYLSDNVNHAVVKGARLENEGCLHHE